MLVPPIAPIMLSVQIVQWVKIILCTGQRCQPAEISAAKRKSGPRKISAAEKIRGRILRRFPKKWQKRGQTF
jgi:hypothetical protein